MDLSLFASVGWKCAAGVVVACWLTVSFAGSEPARRRLGWVGAVAMYVTLLLLFLAGFLKAQASASRAGMIGFGLLLAFFGVGLLLALQRTVRAFAGKEAGAVESATH